MMKKVLVLLFVISALVSCKSNNKKENQPTPVTSSPNLKAETCLFANGKAFSSIRQACVELDSLPYKLNPLKEGMMVKGNPAYLLFDSSMTKAELFLPGRDMGVLLQETSVGNWTDKNYDLIAWKGFVVKLNDEPIYGGQ